MSALFSLLLLFWSTPAIHGSTITAQSASFTDVNIAVSASHDGDTVVVPAGAVTWNGSITISKGITLQGAGKTQTIITGASTVVGGSTPFLIMLTEGGGNNSIPRRVTGFGFKSTVIASSCFNKAVNGIVCYGWLSQKRIDHCRFDDLHAGIVGYNSNGVSDHNEYYNVGYVWSHGPNGNGQQYAYANFIPFPFDSLNYFFHENEYAELSGTSALINQQYGNSYVIRYCNIILREAHGPYGAADCYNIMETHGDEQSSDMYSGISILVYENNFQYNTGTGSTFFQMRGGQGLFFNNRVVTTGSIIGGYAGVQLVEEQDIYHTPNWAHSDHVHNTYVWNNTFNGTVQGPQIGPGTTSLTIGASPAACPSCSAWTTAPSPLLLPTNPHPLVTGEPTPTPTPSPAPTATPSPGQPLGLSFNSTAGDITAPFAVNTDNSISQSVDTGDPTQGGRAAYTFNVTDAGDYTMLSMVNCAGLDSNSFFVDLDGDPISTMVWHVPVTSGFESRTVTWSGITTPRFWELGPGIHQLVIRGREAAAKIKSITLVARPATPAAPQVVPGAGN